MALPFPTGGIATVRVPRRATAAIHTLLKKKSSYNRNISIRKCSTRWGGWRGVGRCGTSEWSEENAMVEEEVFQFMDLSDKPNHFPTKQELLNAGRSDLVFKILAQGGWLAAGWDYHDAETLHTSSDYGSADDQDDCNGDVLPVLDSPSIIDVSAEDVSNKPEKIASEESGIAAILNGLERERTHFYSEASEAKRGNRHQQFSEDKEYGNALQARQPLSVNSKRKADDRNLNIKNGQDIFHDHGRETADAGYNNKDIDSGENFVQPERWDIPSMQQMEKLGSETKGMPGISGTFWQRQRRVGEHISSQAMHVDESRRVVVDKIDEIIEKGQEWMWNVKRSYSGQSQRIYPSGVPNTVMSRIQKLESQLVSTLGSLKSGKDAMDLKKNDDKSALEELEKASDALEFRETEIMKMRTKLRTTRAKLAALEGTMAMEIMEVRKSIEEKQKKVDAAQKVLSLLRTAHIVWPNSASEVFLAGSFDGWTSQRRMGKSNAGVFVLSMHLYPGRYEIKFIVDGIWRVDPQRPVVYNNGKLGSWQWHHCRVYSDIIPANSLYCGFRLLLFCISAKCSNINQEIIYDF